MAIADVLADKATKPKQKTELLSSMLLDKRIAFAPGKMLKPGTAHHKTLLPALENVCENEEKNSIRKIYLAAFKKAGK